MYYLLWHTDYTAYTGGTLPGSLTVQEDREEANFIYGENFKGSYSIHFKPENFHSLWKEA